MWCMVVVRACVQVRHIMSHLAYRDVANPIFVSILTPDVSSNSHSWCGVDPTLDISVISITHHISAYVLSCEECHHRISVFGSQCHCGDGCCI